MAKLQSEPHSRKPSEFHNSASDELVEDRRSCSAGECAKMAGVSTDTLRYYERQRLLRPPPRGSNGYRRYPADALPRIRLIRSALAVGFSVEELAKILHVRDRGLAPCQGVRQLAVDKLDALDSRIRELQHLRTALKETIADWDQRLAKTPSGKQASLLENLASAWPSTSRQLSPLLAPELRRKLNQKSSSGTEKNVR